MRGSKHRRFGGGTGGTLGNSVMTAYATQEQMEAEQVAFARALYRRMREDRLQHVVKPDSSAKFRGQVKS